MLEPVVSIAAKCGWLLQQKFIALTKPATNWPLLGAAFDLTKSNPQLLAENALLHQQLLVLNRQVKHSKFTPRDRLVLVILASLVSNLKQVLLILKPDTLVGWHRQGYKFLGNSNLNPKIGNPEFRPKPLPLLNGWQMKIHCGEPNGSGRVVEA